MTRVDIVSGFLGAGKTTLIKKMIKEAFAGQQVVLIENEFGEIGIDGGFLKKAGIQITELNAGCICCSLVGDFGKALREVQDRYNPDRIIIEPSGVGKLSDVIRAVLDVTDHNSGMQLENAVAVVDATKAKLYMKNFGEFFNNQIESASAIILSRSQNCSEEKLQETATLLKQHNAKAVVITTPWDDLDGNTILHAVSNTTSLLEEVMEQIKSDYHEDEHHHHEDEHHYHEDEHHHHEDEHHHHEDEHHHHEDEHHHHEEVHHVHAEDHVSDGKDHVYHHTAHDHHHHGHDHDADEVFTSWGAESPKTFTKAEIEDILTKLDSGEYGFVLRAKGIVPTADGRWIHYDYVPGESNVRYGSADYTGRLCVIGAELKEDKLDKLFRFA